MTDDKITALPAASALTDADLLPIAQDVSTTPETRKTTGTLVKSWLKAYFDALYLAIVSPGTSGNVLTSNGSAWTSSAPSAGGGDKYPMEARLTLETGVAVSTTDQLAKTTLYLTPHMGNQVATYDGVSAWSVIQLTGDLSLSLSGYTANKNYDIWVYNNAGTLTLESTVWTNDTTRATALAQQNGVYVKSGATTRRYVGTIRITATTGQCEDSILRRYVWNYYNRRKKEMWSAITTASWTYATNTWRSANADDTLRVQMVVGVSEDIVSASVGIGVTGANVAGSIGIGLDKTNDNDARDVPSIRSNSTSFNGAFAFTSYRGYVGAGYHYLQWVERVNVATVTYFNYAVGLEQHGIGAEILC